MEPKSSPSMADGAFFDFGLACLPAEIFNEGDAFDHVLLTFFLEGKFGRFWNLAPFRMLDFGFLLPLKRRLHDRLWFSNLIFLLDQNRKTKLSNGSFVLKQPFWPLFASRKKPPDRF